MLGEANPNPDLVYEDLEVLQHGPRLTVVRGVLWEVGRRDRPCHRCPVLGSGRWSTRGSRWTGGVKRRMKRERGQ